MIMYNLCNLYVKTEISFGNVCHLVLVQSQYSEHLLRVAVYWFYTNVSTQNYLQCNCPMNYYNTEL